jgi:ATP-dependent DNA helicase RecG
MTIMLTQTDYETLDIRCPADVLFRMPDRVVGYQPVANIRNTPAGQKVAITARVEGYRVVPEAVCVVMRTAPDAPCFGVLFPNISATSVPPYISRRLELGLTFTLAGLVTGVPAALAPDIVAAIKNIVSISDRGQLIAVEARFYKRRGVSGGAIGATVQSAKTHWPVPDIIQVPGLPSLPDAIKASMYTTKEDFINTPAGKTMALADLLATRVMIKRARADQQARPAPIITPNSALRMRFVSEVCPYALTQGQQDVAAGLVFDTANARGAVVEGDVGTGKTLVAMLAMLDCVSAGHHAVLAVPLGTLARQHFEELARYCKPLGVHCALITTATTKKTRAQLIEKMQTVPTIMIGTHAALDLVHANVGLLVIDEQHLFGVRQREHLIQACTPRPHLLMLSATAQPRTLGQLMAGDIRRTVLKEKPPGRAPITTQTFPGAEIDDITDAVDRYITRTKQAVYWVLPAVGENELGLPHVDDRLASVSAALPHRRVAGVHGEMKDRQLNKVLDEFRSGAIDILVASTVVQVGISVPEANLIVVEGANRFGVAQLHQLRGRVGRGQHPGECWLVTDAPNDRCEVVARSTDGFALARYDAAVRGMGNQLGVEQHGGGDFRIFDPTIHGSDAMMAACDAAMAGLTPETENTLLEFFGFGEWTKVRIRS